MNLVDRFEKSTKELVGAVEEVESRFRVLCEAESQVDKEITDLLHLIEFENFNAAEGYCLSQQLKEARQRRREIKNESRILHSIKTMVNKSFRLNDHVKGLDEAIKVKKNEIKCATYEPRIRTDMMARFNRINAKEEEGVN